MRAPPWLAVWLIARFGPKRYREALLGDLSEQFAAGRGSAWYWRQAFAAVAGERWQWNRPLVAALKTALLALGLILMGAGTLSWAQTLDRDCGEATCPR